MNSFKYSNAGDALTELYEGLRLTSYQDVAGYWTIGYGHKSVGLHAGMTITQAQATALLEADLLSAETVVNRCVKVAINQNQFDALVDFSYNVGVGAFASSELLLFLNEGKTADAAAQFPLWDHAGGKPLPALLKRRLAEAALFIKPYAPPAPNAV